MKNKGFTLLELLVVIGIMAILISLVSVSYTNAQKSSRDARRKQDLKIIQNAMEQYYTQSSYNYPPSTNCSGNSCSAISSYIQGGVPVDPINGTVVTTVGTKDYMYAYASSASGYTVTAQMEKESQLQITNLQ